MNKELIEKRIVELATNLTTTKSRWDKYIIKLFLNYYVQMALKNNN